MNPSGLDSNGPLTPEGGYDPAFFDRLATIEDRHFWFATRNNLIFHVARRAAVRFGPDSLVLEAGCGTGNVLRFLVRACPNSLVIGMDMSIEGLRHAKRRTNCMLVQGDLRARPLSQSFDLLGMFDVLEHVPNDEEVLRDAYSMLRPGGTILVTVPAHMRLWSYFDVAAHHCRRYATDELSRKLTAAGFKISFLTQFMAVIYLPVWLMRRVSALLPSRISTRLDLRHQAEQELRIIPVVNSIVRLVLTLENRWVLSGRRLPLGTSLLAVARRPGDAG